MITKNLKFLIQEEVIKFLNEAVDHTDDELVNKNNIDLQYEYDKLNQLLFDSTLPNVPLKWDISKVRLGAVTGAHNRITGEMKVVYLKMSAFYKTNYRQFKNTFAHEMIHVKQIVFSHGADHGRSFDREAYRINGMGLGYNITHKNNEEIQMSDEVKANAKTLIAIIYNIDGQYFLTVTTPSVYNSDFDSLLNYFQREVNYGKHRNVEITVVESKNPELMSKRILRSIKKSFSYIRLSDNFLEQLLDDNIIKNIKIKKGVPAEISETELTGNPNDWEIIEIS